MAVKMFVYNFTKKLKVGRLTENDSQSSSQSLVSCARWASQRVGPSQIGLSSMLMIIITEIHHC